MNKARAMNSLSFKIATEPDELRQIRELNYRTFVDEIPQHSPNPDRALTDRFEKENICFVCRRGHDVVGMIALRCNRPFSLDEKLPNLDAYLPPHRSPCEIRLLAVDPKLRSGRVLAGLIERVYRFFEMRGHDLALISGTLRQTRLYEHMGFVAFGPVVGTPEAPYQPMYQFAGRFRDRAAELGSASLSDIIRTQTNLLPGPIRLAPGIQSALSAPPVSHRSETFKQSADHVRRLLCALTSAPKAVMALGSGTLANDLVAGQLAQIPGCGLILDNGEFGRRLTDHAARFGLDFETVTAAWGASIAESDIRQGLDHGKPKRWIWAVHAETSTGVLNDVDTLKRLSNERDIPLCLDCVSALGMVPCDLRGVALASGVSGKGLRSMSGLALVFHDRTLPPSVRPTPRYLDLRLYRDGHVPFTLPSNLVTALGVALETMNPTERYREIEETSAWLCRQLQDVGIQILAPENARFPGVITLPLPPHANVSALGDALQREGWWLSYESPYLVERNWIQICLFESAKRDRLELLLRLLADRLAL